MAEEPVEDGVGTPVERADAACHEAFEAWLAARGEDVWPALQAALVQARKAHRTALQEHGIGRACPDEADAAREQLAGYVLAVADDVHAPLRAALEEIRPLATLASTFEQAASDAVEAVAALPRSQELERAPGALGSAPADGAGRRLRKALARVGATVARSGTTRTVGLQAVTRRHMIRRVQPAAQALFDDVTRAQARWLVGLESAWTEWAHNVLVAAAEPPTPPVDEGPPLDAWATAAAAGNALEEALSRCCDASPWSDAVDPAPLAACRERLADDLGVAGTPGFPAMPAAPPPGRAWATRTWLRWEDQVLDRFTFHQALFDVMDAIRGIRRIVPARLRADVTHALSAAAGSAATALEGLYERVEQIADLDAELAEVRAAAEAALDEVRAVRPVAPYFEEAVHRGADSAIARLQSVIRATPAEVTLHPLPSRPEELRTPPRDVRPVRLQDMARQAFDALRMERVRTAPAQLIGAAPRVAAALDEVSEVVAFGFEAAQKERREADAEADDRARSLVSQGLMRAAEALRGAEAPVDEVLALVRSDLARELAIGRDRLVGRAMADRVQGRLLDARSRLVRSLASFRERARPGMARATRFLRMGWLYGKRTTLRLARRGRLLVGAPRAAAGLAARTARSLATADAMMLELPLVYQRLFSTEPVSDPALLVGREVDLADAERRWQRWQDEDGVPLIVTGRRGTGVSSFLRVFAERIRAGGGRVALHVLERRYEDEAELAGELAALLEVPATPTLDALAATILRAPADSLPDLVALEQLEHLYLRVPSGTDLVERVLTLMAETEPRIFWMGSMNFSAWQLVEKTEPTAVAQVDRMPLGQLTPDTLRAAVLARHRRSGLVLHFEEPHEGRRLLRRRLNRARGSEARNAILERDFFERLHRACQGNLRLALFQWLRAADFTAREGELTVRPLPTLDFSFLSGLDLTQNFTLKALLEHRTLTLAEHDKVFRIPRQESYQIFESLGNRHVIRSVARGDDDASVSEVEDALRYEIGPLLVGAVNDHLAGQNIVH